MTTISATYFKSLRDPVGQRFTASWAKLCQHLAKPVVSAEKEAVGGISFCTFADNKRALSSVELAYAVGLDLDDVTSMSRVVRRYEGRLSFMHTTWSSTLAEPRMRVFLPLSRPVTADEYRRVYRHVTAEEEAAGILCDRATSDASRFWFLPSIQKANTPMVYKAGRGLPVDVDAALERTPPAPVYVPSAIPFDAGDNAVVRARAYLDRCDIAISGQGGHRLTFVIASKLVRGFGLSEEQALSLMGDWNSRCKPPWSERELARKVKQAADTSRMPVGALLERKVA